MITDLLIITGEILLIVLAAGTLAFIAVLVMYYLGGEIASGVEREVPSAAVADVMVGGIREPILLPEIEVVPAESGELLSSATPGLGSAGAKEAASHAEKGIR